MQRYDIPSEYDPIKQPDGEWVLYLDAQARIAELEARVAELEAADAERKRVLNAEAERFRQRVRTLSADERALRGEETK